MREREREREKVRELNITRLELSYVTTQKTKVFPGAGAELRCMGTMGEFSVKLTPLFFFTIGRVPVSR